MARGFSMLALFLLATAVAATMAKVASPNGGIHDFCKGKVYESLCVEFFAPLVTPKTDFNSLEWRRAVLKTVLKRAETAKKMVMKQDKKGLSEAEQKDLKSCQNNMLEGVGNLRKAVQEYNMACKNSRGSANYKKHGENARDYMDEAAYNHESCDDLLNGDGGEFDKLKVEEIRFESDESHNLNIVAQDILFPVSEFPDTETDTTKTSRHRI